jgi:hypothetical protein
MQDDFTITQSTQGVVDDRFLHARICDDGLAADPFIHVVSHCD